MSARRCGRLDRDRSADHGSDKTERAESVGKRGAPRLAAFPVDRRVPIDRFAESDLKAGGNDLANGEAQGNMGTEADERRVGFLGEVLASSALSKAPRESRRRPSRAAKPSRIRRSPASRSRRSPGS